AAEHALRRGALEVAADLEEQSARRTSPHIELRLRRCLRAARHHLKAGDPGRSRALCEEVVDGTSRSSVRAHALQLLAESSALSSLTAGVSLLEEALACVGDDTGHAAQLEIALGSTLMATFDLERAHRHLIRAVALAERAGNDALTADAIALEALSGLLSGRG